MAAAVCVGELQIEDETESGEIRRARWLKHFQKKGYRGNMASWKD